MKPDYDFKGIEQKWQEIWETQRVHEAVDFGVKPKFFGLIEFPYPSGSGLHMGHLRAFTSLEIVSRKRRLEGYNVLFPIGFDAFGLPTENYAMQTGRHPRSVTDDNIKTFTSQLKALGYSFDYSRVVDTTDKDYYKWTQWIFVQLFKKGLAYKSTAYVNYCEKCKVILANEESQGGVCDRCGSDVIQKEKDVWFLKIRDYAESLLDGLEGLDYLPRIKTEQINWIGKSEGAEIDFAVKGGKPGQKLRVFTTRADTLFGVTFMVVAPEHPIIAENAGFISNLRQLEDYRAETRKKNEFERAHVNKDKTGVKIQGLTAVNPINGLEIPIFIADYVTPDYGTGAVMAVPAHDTRDYEFAKKFDLPIVEVIAGGDISREAYTDIQNGVMVNSGFLNGLSVKEAGKAVVGKLTADGIGCKKINYNMKDWAFNRQRYWGEPIPIIYCPKCGAVPVPEADLPVVLPPLDRYRQSETGESPLAGVSDFVNCKCPVCGADAKRETDTMPQWAGSSWYYLRYIDPKNPNALADYEKLKYFGPVDWYNGGMEHVTRHLIYSRFWNQFLYDIGVVPFREPYKKRTAQGLILGEDGAKMSKSLGNVVSPDSLVRDFGADVIRLYTMFIGDYESSIPWSNAGIIGCRRFIERVYNLLDIADLSQDSISQKREGAVNRLIKKVSEDIECLKFNTAIAAMMTFLNEVTSENAITKGELRILLLLLYPFAPHISEEINELLGYSTILAKSDYPKYDPSKLTDAEIELPVQINGRLKGTVRVAAEASLDEVKAAVRANPALSALLSGNAVKKEIYVPKKILNLII
ncbi:MAG: leucine--tRNA ligase [Clostridiales bacterium]|jgi:leucyl-tRNA synthetase|nr:leucine--tRNA ligase [Clostridiales bacterium]